LVLEKTDGWVKCGFLLFIDPSLVERVLSAVELVVVKSVTSLGVPTTTALGLSVPSAVAWGVPVLVTVLAGATCSAALGWASLDGAELRVN